MTFTTLSNVVACALLAVAAVIYTVVATRHRALLAATERRSEWTGLPLGSVEIVDAIVARLRSSHLATGWTLAAGAAVAGAVAGIAADTTPRYLLAAAPFVFIAVAVAATVVTVTRPLITPPVGAPRVARASTRRVGDYLAKFRRRLPWWVTATAGAWTAILIVRGDATVVGVITVAVAAVSLTTLPWLDRSVLDAPQAATHTLELAWDDAFRADALGVSRATICLVALTGCLVGQLGVSSWEPVILNVLLTAVAVTYSRAPLRAVLLPPWLAIATAGRR